MEQLAESHQAGLVRRIARMAADANVTLVYAAKDSQYNNARVLEGVLRQAMKDLF